MSDVRLPSGVVYRHDPDGHREDREQLVSYGIRLLDDGLAVGSAGNMSVRVADTVLITPSGVAYRDMQAADMCVVGLDGALFWIQGLDGALCRGGLLPAVSAACRLAIF